MKRTFLEVICGLAALVLMMSFHHQIAQISQRTDDSMLQRTVEEAVRRESQTSQGKLMVVDACGRDVNQEPKALEGRPVLSSGDVPARTVPDSGFLENRLSGGTFKVFVPDYEVVIADLRREISGLGQQQATVLMWLVGGLGSLLLMLLTGAAFAVKRIWPLLDQCALAEVPQRRRRRGVRAKRR
jgi:hypothetical protein